MSDTIREDISGKRDTSISICKGIAIILMVIGHAEAPEIVTNFIYTFHMPLFFITAGYFFKETYAGDPWKFCAKRVKGLYIPFLKWSLLFLILHNLWFEIGLLNEQYGNWTGGVTHPYTWKVFFQRLTLIFTSMSGYDEFIAGAFWFFRGLMVASIIFLIIFRLIYIRYEIAPWKAALSVCVGAVAFCAFHIVSGVRLTYFPNGFWRETWGIFFFGIGFIFRIFEGKVKSGWFLSLIFFILLCIAASFHFSGMNNSGRLRDLWTLPLTGIMGFLMVRQVAGKIDKYDSRVRRLLVFIGDNTLYILVFHILAFKVVSLIKIWWYDLDFKQIGCHMVIHENNSDLFWIIYSVAGVALPLCGLIACRSFRNLIMSKSVFSRMSIRMAD